MKINDIGYCIDEEEHPKYSLKILKDLSYEISKTLEDCILNHGSDKEPITPEGKVFQMADKISILDIETLQSFLKNKDINREDLVFIEEMIKKAASFINKLN